jgi:hypothetical protein
MDMATALMGSWATSEKTSVMQGLRLWSRRRMSRGRECLACGLGFAEEARAEGQVELPGRHRDGHRPQVKISRVREGREAA